MTRDQLLTQVSLYWLTNTAATSARIYFEDARAGAEPRVNHARTGVAVFASDFRTVRVFAERDNTRIEHWSTYDEGGHFAALERPADVAADIRAFFAG